MKYKHILSRTYLACALLLALFSFSSCSLDTDDSNELGQFWHLVSVDTLSTGRSADVAAKRVFWSAQGVIFQVGDYSRIDGKRYVFHYEHQDGTLRLYEPRLLDRSNGDPLITDEAVLSPYGINNLETTFTIEALTGSEMVLSDSKVRLHFRAQ